MTPRQFRNLVLRHYRAHGRHHLPWRKTHNPYRILVSEIMLQQTQVERVVPFYRNFLKKFPTVKTLANAPLSEVLIAWQGLGYNRRAKRLHEAAKEIVEQRKGTFPKTAQELQALPGVGPYTASAVAAFAFNKDGILIETNIRTVVTNHFFKNKKNITDVQIQKILAEMLPTGNSREWYGALMDYGAHLKRSGIQINAKSKHYTKQAAFEGSAREARGTLLRELSKGTRRKRALLTLFETTRKEQVEVQIEKLLAEGLIAKGQGGFSLPQHS